MKGRRGPLAEASVATSEERVLSVQLLRVERNFFEKDEKGGGAPLGETGPLRGTVTAGLSDNRQFQRRLQRGH